MIDDFNLVLLSGGFHRCDPSWNKPATGIDECYKVYIPIAGRAVLQMQDGSHEIRPGRIYFISGFRLRAQRCPGTMAVYWAHFVPESLYLRYLLDQLPPVCSWSRRRADWPAKALGEISRLFQNPLGAEGGPRTDRSPAIDCRIQAFLMGLISRLLETLDSGRVQAFQPEYYRLKGAFDFMQSHFKDNPPLSQIAARAGLAPNYFHRRFRGLFGTTPFNFMLAQRLNQARRLLSSSHLSVKEVAAAVGYDDPPYFTRVFSHQMQISPSAYRATHRAVGRTA